MLSGIGPGEHLKEMGIEVVKHLPGVGSNLHDHIAIPHIFYSKNSSGLYQAMFCSLQKTQGRLQKWELHMFFDSNLKNSFKISKTFA